MTFSLWKSTRLVQTQSLRVAAGPPAGGALAIGTVCACVFIGATRRMPAPNSVGVRGCGPVCTSVCICVAGGSVGRGRSVELP